MSFLPLYKRWRIFGGSGHSSKKEGLAVIISPICYSLID
jgi:hypothetical protein